MSLTRDEQIAAFRAYTAANPPPFDYLTVDDTGLNYIGAVVEMIRDGRVVFDPETQTMALVE